MLEHAVRSKSSPRLRAVAQTIAVLLLAALPALAEPRASTEGHDATASACVEQACGERCQEALDLARRSTAAFVREQRALDAGFVPDPICVANPAAGGMGIHYLDRGRMDDIQVDPRFPEILLYEERPGGQRVLVALEYFAPVLSNGVPWMGSATQPPPTIDNPPPVLFGRRFDGPMPGHAPGMPWHYDLHAWVWRHNPAGTFAPFNPKVRCR